VRLSALLVLAGCASAPPRCVAPILANLTLCDFYPTDPSKKGVNELPRLKFQPSSKGRYPPEALRAQFEGNVVLRLAVDERGSVTHIEVVSDPGHGLGRAAERFGWELVFTPALVGGKPVPVTIPFTTSRFREAPDSAGPLLGSSVTSCPASRAEGVAARARGTRSDRARIAGEQAPRATQPRAVPTARAALRVRT